MSESTFIIDDASQMPMKCVEELLIDMRKLSLKLLRVSRCMEVYERVGLSRYSDTVEDALKALATVTEYPDFAYLNKTRMITLYDLDPKDASKLFNNLLFPKAHVLVCKCEVFMFMDDCIYFEIDAYSRLFAHLKDFRQQAFKVLRCEPFEDEILDKGKDVSLVEPFEEDNVSDHIGELLAIAKNESVCLQTRQYSFHVVCKVVRDCYEGFLEESEFETYKLLQPFRR